jgi:iron-sulfur cluster repair protein YtfE (RIC family)
MISREGLDRVKQEHRDLRALLTKLDEAATRVLGHAAGAVSELREAVRLLDVSFRAHLLMEEAQLVPTLSPGALERLRAEHAEQRAALSAIAGEVDHDTHEPSRLADDVRWLVDGLLRDMKDEDAALDGLAASLQGGA